MGVAGGGVGEAAARGPRPRVDGTLKLGQRGGLWAEMGAVGRERGVGGCVLRWGLCAEEEAVTFVWVHLPPTHIVGLYLCFAETKWGRISLAYFS